MKIFIDTNIIKFSRNRLPRLFPNTQNINWGGQSFTVDVFSPGTLLPNEKIPGEKLKAETMSLPKIAEYAKNGRIELITHSEVIFEFWGLPGSLGSGGCFEGIDIKWVEDPFEYSRIFCGFGCRPANELQVEFLENVKDKRFEQLQKACGAYQGEKGLKSNELKDAFYVYCAESAGADYFLTCDFKLINQIKNHKKYPPKVKLITPSGLIEIIERQKR